MIRKKEHKERLILYSMDNLIKKCYNYCMLVKYLGWHSYMTYAAAIKKIEVEKF